MNEEKVLAGLSCCIKDGGKCKTCPYKKGESEYKCNNIQMLRESKELIEIKNKLLDFLIAECGIDICSKCIYSQYNVSDDGDCACKQEELEGVNACRKGMMAYFATSKRMKVIFLNVKDKKPPEVMEIDGELDTIKRLIGCEHIDSTVYKVGGIPFRVIVDDEGYFKKNYIESANSSRYLYPLVGNLVIFGKENRHGDLMSLSDSLAKRILRRFHLDADGYYRLYAD